MYRLFYFFFRLFWLMLKIFFHRIFFFNLLLNSYLERFSLFFFDLSIFESLLKRREAVRPINSLIQVNFRFLTLPVKRLFLDFLQSFKHLLLHIKHIINFLSILLCQTGSLRFLLLFNHLNCLLLLLRLVLRHFILEIIIDRHFTFFH